nr:polysaccharide pyruvyl transferase family protein [Agromyces sp. Marseille-P2726]
MLLPRYGLVPVHRRSVDARLAGVGSIVEHLPPGFSGAVWGSGLLHDASHPMPEAHLLAVRGVLTAERVGAGERTALGDPGLLVGRQRRRREPKWDVGIVLHFSQRGTRSLTRLAEGSGLRARLIDVRRAAAPVVREISQCATIVTTSLHGLVTADAFGIPTVWLTAEPGLREGTFKFRDYESVVTSGWSRHLAFDERMSLANVVEHAEAAPRSTVDAACEGLEAAIHRLPEVLVSPLESFPWGIPTVMQSRTPTPRSA